MSREGLFQRQGAPLVAFRLKDVFSSLPRNMAW